jgi:hypothetical protein
VRRLGGCELLETRYLGGRQRQLELPCGMQAAVEKLLPSLAYNQEGGGDAMQTIFRALGHRHRRLEATRIEDRG